LANQGFHSNLQVGARENYIIKDISMRLLAILGIGFVALASPRPVWQGPRITLLGGPSKDGNWLSYVDRGDLAVREISTGRTVVLTHRAEDSKEFAYFSVISPDSKRIAYAWFNEFGFYDLRVMALDGADATILFRNEEAGFVQPCAWSPDASQILTLLFRKDNTSQIVLQPAAGGRPKVLKSLNWIYPKKMDLSPDGRFIVYDSFAAESSRQRTIYLLATDGSVERKLIEEPGEHLFPLWTPDGKSILYTNDRGSGMEVWALEVTDGKPAGQPRRIMEGLGRMIPLGMTRDGTYYFGLRVGGTDVYVAEIENGKRGEPRAASLRFPGRNSQPAWSPDGNWLAFLSRRGSENFAEEGRVIVLRAAKGTEERELCPKLARMASPRWSPDGKWILVRGTDRQGRNGVYGVSLETGEAKMMEDSLSPERSSPEVSMHPNGRIVAYTDGATRSEVWSVTIQ
jgi:Tol biopolymer transport system component